MLTNFGKAIVITTTVFLAAFEYRTAALEFVWPVQGSGNTFWHHEELPPSPQGEKQITITFDDGPSAYTTAILDILKEQQLSSIFFMMGRQVEAHPELERRVVREGHRIGNHGYDLIAQKGLKKYYLTTLSKANCLTFSTTGRRNDGHNGGSHHRVVNLPMDKARTHRSISSVSTFFPLEDV